MASGFGKANAKGRSKQTFLMLTHHTIDSPAYRSLSLVARAIWIEVYRRYNGFNNGKIPLSCREASDLVGVGKGTAGRGFQELIEKGFIEITQHASFNMKGGWSRRWRLTHERCDEKPPTNEWRKWKPKN